MNELNKSSGIRVFAQPQAEVVDEGLRSYMIKVFNYMAGSLLVAGIVAYLFANTGLIKLLYNIDYANQTASISGIGWLVMLAPLAMIFAFHYVLTRKSLAAVQLVFWSFSVLEGASLAYVFLAYSGASITRVFFITAITFSGMGILGYSTKRDLSKLGSYLYMGVLGLFVALIVNMFLKSSGLDYALSVIGVLLFTGLTAADMQNIKMMYYRQDDSDVSSRKAIAGALSLYLDFINLFLMLLRLMGDRR